MSIIKYYNKPDAEKAVNSSKIPFGNKVWYHPTPTPTPTPLEYRRVL